jgi:hypothetical protein
MTFQTAVFERVDAATLDHGAMNARVVAASLSFVHIQRVQGVGAVNERV